MLSSFLCESSLAESRENVKFFSRFAAEFAKLTKNLPLFWAKPQYLRLSKKQWFQGGGLWYDKKK